MLPTLPAYAARYIRGVAAVLEVVSAGCRQRSLHRGRPLFVGFGEPPDLVRGQSKAAERLPELLAGMDRIEELLPYLDW
jgi:hypothetical protein